MINLHIEASDHFDLHAKLKGILYGLAREPALAIEEKPVVTIGNNAEASGQVTVEPVKRTRKPKADAPAETKPEPEPEVKAEEPKAHPDIEALRDALKRLASAEGHGADAVFELLGQYGVKNASTLPEDKRAEVIAKINEKLGG